MPAQRPGRSKQDYGTPKALLNAVRDRLHIAEFDIDVAASQENAVCPKFFTEEDDALIQDWKVGTGWNWLNPPFGQLELWTVKAKLEAEKGAQTVMLVPVSPGSNWWAEYVEPFVYVSYLHGRVTFVGATGPYPKDTAILLYTPWGVIGHEIWYWRGRKEQKGQK